MRIVKQIAKVVLGIFFIFGLTVPSKSTTVSHFVEPTITTLNFSSGIVEGEIVNILGMSKKQKYGCISSVYDLRVMRSWTADIKIGTVITIGEYYEFSIPKIGNIKFIAFGDFQDAKYRSICSNLKVENAITQNMKIPFAHSISVFDVQIIDSSDSIFSSSNCNQKSYFLFEKEFQSFVKVTKNKNGCLEVKGNYKLLIESLEKILDKR